MREAWTAGGTPEPELAQHKRTLEVIAKLLPSSRHQGFYPNYTGTTRKNKRNLSATIPPHALLKFTVSTLDPSHWMPPRPPSKNLDCELVHLFTHAYSCLNRMPYRSGTRLAVSGMNPSTSVGSRQGQSDEGPIVRRARTIHVPARNNVGQALPRCIRGLSFHLNSDHRVAICECLATIENTSREDDTTSFARHPAWRQMLLFVSCNTVHGIPVPCSASRTVALSRWTCSVSRASPLLRSDDAIGGYK